MLIEEGSWLIDSSLFNSQFWSEGEYQYIILISEKTKFQFTLELHPLFLYDKKTLIPFCCAVSLNLNSLLLNEKELELRITAST